MLDNFFQTTISISDMFSSKPHQKPKSPTHPQLPPPETHVKLATNHLMIWKPNLKSIEITPE